MGLAEPSGLAADTWERFDEAVERVVEVGADHVVTSLEWARLWPSRRDIDEAALARYAEFLDALRGAGIHPFVRLGSALVPEWAGEEFWLMPGSPERFVDAVIEIVDRIGPQCASWISVSDAVAAAVAGWLSGEAPPFRRLAVSDARLVLDNFLTAHVLLSGALFERGVDTLALELPALGFEVTGAVEVALAAARAGTSVEQAVAAARPHHGDHRDLAVLLNPAGVSGTAPTRLHPLITKLLNREIRGRWVSEAERLASRTTQTAIACDLTRTFTPRLEKSSLVALTKRSPTRRRRAPLPESSTGTPWFIDEVVAMVRNEVVISEPLPGGIDGHFEARAAQLHAISGPVRYTYNALFDGYVDGSFAPRNGLFGIDRARGTRGLTWLSTNRSGSDAAAAFRRFATSVRDGVVG
jgi:hypothetical protein